MIIASLVAVAALWYSNVQAQQQNVQAQQQRATEQEGQITDRYIAAVENLGDDAMDVRLGGIYALQRIMQDSVRDHPTIVNVLTAYVRGHAALPDGVDQNTTGAREQKKQQPELSEPDADVQAALSVLAFRDINHDGDRTRINRIRIDLHSTDLRGADLRGAHLRGADLRGADLFLADLRGEFPFLADLRGADLRGAYLHLADLRGANLRGADLRGAVVTARQVAAAELNKNTKLSPEIASDQAVRDLLLK